jgi:hypothetical protein
MMDAFLDYLEWCEANPIYELKGFSSGLSLKMPKMRAATMDGFCSHMMMSPSTFRVYRDRDDYADTVALINSILFSTKFEGAAAGVLNANIIARDLGLSEKVETDQTVTVEVIDNFEGPDGQDNPSE